MATQYFVNRVPEVVITTRQPVVAEPKAEYGKRTTASPAPANR